MYGGLEAGGTKFVCVIGTEPGDIQATERIAVTTPAETIPRAIAFFRAAIEAGTMLDAIGIGSFGPLELRTGHPRHGFITTTPKPGWSDTDLAGTVSRDLRLPVAIDTDVNAALLAEVAWGAARGLRDVIYLTIGTGIGGGALADGRLVNGLGHPEMGHVAVDRHPDDDYAGHCPFHGACLEGMASGPSLQARFGRRAERLTGADQRRAVDLVAHYLASGVRSLTYTLAPARIVIGGGVGRMPGLLDRTRASLPQQLAGYPGLPEHAAPDYLVTAALGDMAGPTGTLLLAAAASG